MTEMNIFKKGFRFLKENKRTPSANEIYRFLKIKRKIMPPPTLAQIEPTTRCNFNCVYCSRTKLDKSILNKDLSLDEFKTIINKIPSIKKIILQGIGEPFLNKNLKQILDFGSKNNIIFETICNGSLLIKNIELIQYFNRIGISLDSANPKKYAEIRRNASFPELLKNLEVCSKYKEQKKLNVKLGFQVVISHLNCEEIKDIINLAKFYGLNYVAFQETINWGLYGESNLEICEFIKESRKKTDYIKQEIEKNKSENNLLEISFSPNKERKLNCIQPFGFFI